MHKVTEADLEVVKAVIAATSFSRNGALPTTTACEAVAEHRVAALEEAANAYREGSGPNTWDYFSSAEAAIRALASGGE